MLIIKKIIKHIISPILVSVGFEKLFSLFSRNKNLILCFHGVSNASNILNSRHMSVEQFEALMIYLKNNFEIVPIKDFFIDSPTKKKRIGVTFDDGYLNNYSVVWPILKKYQIPATFFITTEAFEIKDYCLWPELFDVLKISNHPDTIFFNNEAFYFDNKQLIQSESKINIFDYVKQMGEERLLAFKEFILNYNIKSSLTKLDPEIIRFCSKEQIREMAKSSLVEIGSHTHRHYNLSKINSALAEEELKKSKEILENIIQKPVTSIGYPDGDYSESIKLLAQKAGYLNQFAVSFLAPTDYTDKRIRRRYCVSNTTSLGVNKLLMHLQFRKSGF